VEEKLNEGFPSGVMISFACVWAGLIACAAFGGAKGAAFTFAFAG
jgi:hypothetical protein